MPNWVFNSLTIEGSKDDISAIKQQLNKPYVRQHDKWNMETSQMEITDYTYSNPVFSFWNIISPTDLEAYNGPQPEVDLTKPITFESNHWYDWNVRNWGTKWDIAVHDKEEYPETEITMEAEDTLGYRFNTAWSPPLEAINNLSQQYPDVEFELSFEEETGWGGEVTFYNGDVTETESYENKCRDCESINTLEYCDNDCGEICSSCHYMGEADLDCVAECPEHMQYLDSEHVPDYRMDEANAKLSN
jgi:hypothetical protein